METGLSLSSMVALFGAMAVLAAVPSVSVLAVSARAAAFGFIHGAFTAMGIVAGDIVFILLAIFGLALLVEALGGMFFLIKYVGGVKLAYAYAAGRANSLFWRRNGKSHEHHRGLRHGRGGHTGHRKGIASALAAGYSIRRIPYWAAIEKLPSHPRMGQNRVFPPASLAQIRGAPQ